MSSCPARHNPCEALDQGSILFTAVAAQAFIFANLGNIPAPLDRKARLE